MHATHTASCRKDTACDLTAVAQRIDLIDARHQFFYHVVIPRLMTQCAAAGIAILIRPCFPVDAVYTKILQAPLFQQIIRYFYHAEVFPVIETSILSREHQTRLAGMSIHLKLHFSL